MDDVLFSLSMGTLLQGGKYRIVGMLGRGGFGITYEAEQSILGRRVAIKEFFPKGSCERSPDSALVTSSVSSRADFERYRSKFLKEARTMAGMVHPHIVRIIDLFEENGTAYYVMDYLPGGSLSDMVKRTGPLPPDTAVRYVREVGGALSFLHGHRINHLDVKPGNILLDGEGHAVLIDFGLSKHYDSDGRETSNTPVGISAGYAPLEQYEDGGLSGFSPESDIYALGATLYYLLSGKRPPAASDVLNGGLPRPGVRIPDALWSSILKSMSPGRTSRPRSIDEFLSLPGLSDSGPVSDGVGSGEPTDDEETDTNEKAGKGAGKQEGTDKADSEDPSVGGSSGSGSQSFFRRHRTWMIFAIVAAIAILCTILYIMSSPSLYNYDNYYLSDTTDFIILDSTQYIDSTDAVSSLSDFNSHAGENRLKYAQDFTETVSGVSFDMVCVEGGAFDMGTPSGGYDNERPVHRVTLDGYWIGRHEVTQKLWVAVMGSNPSEFRGDDLPVENVSWNDVQEFITRLNSLTGKKYRLPTEAEWEYAARGGSKSMAYDYSGSDYLDNVGWYWENSGERPHPVGTKLPNELGIYDMSGNVLEWCSDWYGSYPSSSQTNPKGPSDGESKVLRGGSWSYSASNCRSAIRIISPPSNRYSGNGFRLALSL